MSKDSMFLHLKTATEGNVRDWVESLKLSKYVRTALNLDVYIEVNGIPQETSKFIQDNRDVRPVNEIGVLLEIDKEIVKEYGKGIVFWLSRADSATKEKVDILTRAQSRHLTAKKPNTHSVGPLPVGLRITTKKEK